MSKWQNSYSELIEFISRTPQIEIDKSFFIIPGEVRPDFNRRFDAVITAFVEEKFPDYIHEASILGKHFEEAANEVKKTLGLEEIKLPVTLKALVNDPVSGLTRYVLDFMYDLLKGKLDIGTFEEQASENVVSSFQKVFRTGYEKWVLLSLINMLSPDGALAVPPYDIETTTRELEPDEKRGIYKSGLPDVQETKALSFDRAGAEPAFILPDIIVHSTSLESYASVRADLRDASYSAKDVSSEREWLTIRELGILYRPNIFSWPDIVMYTDDKPQNIALVAEFSRFCRPDVIVECIEQPDWFKNEGLTKVIKDYDYFKPLLGTFVVSRVAVPEETVRETLVDRSRNIQILNVGYGKSALKPIIDSLRNCRTK